MKTQQIGPLRCIVIDGSETPTIPVILCHGYGAPGDDLASLTPALQEMMGPAAENFRFVFPEAPGDLAEMGMPEGRAWWPLNMMALQELLQTNRFSELHDKEPPGIDAARDQLAETVRLVLKGMPTAKEDAGEPRPYVLGGFSQGAMLTMDLSLRGTLPPPTMLVQFSGTLVCQSQWTASLDRLANTFVYQSHGRVDPICRLPAPSRFAIC